MNYLSGHCRRHFLRGVAIAALACAHVAPASAQEKSLAMMRKLYTALSNSFTLGENVAAPQRTYLVLLNPGILVDPDLNLEKNDDDRYSLMTFLDEVLNPHWIYDSKGVRLHSIYQNILTFAQLPIVELTKDQRKELSDAQKILFKDISNNEKTDAYLKWETAALEYATAQDDAESWIKNNPGQNPPASKVVRLQQAQYNFENFANGAAIQAAINTDARLKRFTPAAYFASLQKQMDNPLATRVYAGQKYGTYSFYPTYKQWFNSNLGWTAQVYDEKFLEKKDEESITKIDGGGSAGFGFWRASANYSKTTEWTKHENEVNNFSIGGEFMRVTLRRPWLDELLLHSDAWAWPKNAAINTDLISDGGVATGQTMPKGQAPFVPVGLLLAKNVTLSGNWSKDLDTFFKEITDGGAQAGWGPFKFGGRYSSTKSETYKRAESTKSEVKFATPQIIGVYVTVLDKLPNPNPNYKWPDSANVPKPLESGKPFSTILPSGFNTLSLKERGENILQKLRIDQIR